MSAEPCHQRAVGDHCMDMPEARTRAPLASVSRFMPMSKHCTTRRGPSASTARANSLQARASARKARPRPGAISTPRPVSVVAAEAGQREVGEARRRAGHAAGQAGEAVEAGFGVAEPEGRRAQVGHGRDLARRFPVAGRLVQRAHHGADAGGGGRVLDADVVALAGPGDLVDVVLRAAGVQRDGGRAAFHPHGARRSPRGCARRGAVWQKARPAPEGRCRGARAI